MRHLSLVALAGATWAVAGCHDTLPGPVGPDTAIALHFDSLSAQANAASQPNRLAALDLALRALADGTIPSTLILTTGTGAHDTATYTLVTWSLADLVQKATSDSVTDSLLVLVAWRNANADTMVVVRSGDVGVAPEIQGELATLGLTGHLTSGTADTLTSGALVTGNTVALADSGSVEGDFGIFGASCSFVSVSSIRNDSGTQCNREEFLWQWTLRFSPSVTWSLSGSLGASPAYSPGVVIVH